MNVGILGGGQLSRMLALSGIPLGITFRFFNNRSTDGVHALGQGVTASYEDKAALLSFLDGVDVVTFENENIPCSVLDWIKQYKPLCPSSEALSVMQDRYLEKNFFNTLGIPTTRFSKVNHKRDLKRFIETNGLPVVLKKRTHGYDGKNQWVIQDINAFEQLNEDLCHHCIVEDFIQYSREVSMIGCRNAKGEIRFYDLCENQHQKGILFRTQNRPQDKQTTLAQQYLEQVMSHFSYVGVCTIELFEDKGKLIANEMAPRVHNSGHWTIEGSVTSQFENHLRCILDLPLGQTASYGAFVMYNLLGKLPDLRKILQYNGTHVHDYQKQPRKGRKLGHVTVDSTLFRSAKEEQSFFSLLNNGQEMPSFEPTHG